MPDISIIVVTYNSAKDIDRCLGSVERTKDGLEIDMRPAIRAVVEDADAGTSRERIAARFHETVARMTVEVCRRLADEAGLRRVMVTGGVAQNMLLLERVLAGLRRAGLEPYLNRQVPCNDGGLSFGQAVVAAARSSR